MHNPHGCKLLRTTEWHRSGETPQTCKLDPKYDQNSQSAIRSVQWQMQNKKVHKCALRPIKMAKLDQWPSADWTIHRTGDCPTVQVVLDSLHLRLSSAPVDKDKANTFTRRLLLIPLETIVTRHRLWNVIRSGLLKSSLFTTNPATNSCGTN